MAICELMKPYIQDTTDYKVVILTLPEGQSNMLAQLIQFF